MSLQVFFDDTQVNEQYCTELTNNCELFSDNFSLGKTPSNMYTLKVAKEGVSSQPSTVTLKDSGIAFAELEIDNIEEQDYEYVYTLTDKMVDLEFNYNAFEIFVDGSTTLLAIAQDICSKVGLTLGTNNFRGYNKTITWYDGSITARQYIGMIAELNGGFARIINDTLYFVKQNTNSVNTINIEDCEDFKIGEYHKITRVVLDMETFIYEYGNETGNTLYLDNQNVFITEQSEVQAIYNEIKNFEFYSYESSNCPIDYSVKVGDVITFTDGTNNYFTIAQYDLDYFGGWLGGYSLNVNTERQQETQVVGTKQNIRNLKVIVDRDSNTITQLVTDTNDLSSRTTTLETRADGFQIDIEDIQDNGVSQVQTTTGYTFDDEGLKIDKSNAETSTLIDEASIQVLDKTGNSEEELLYAGYIKSDNTLYTDYIGQSIVAVANMIVRKYLNVPNSSFETYENPTLGGSGTGVFKR